MGHQIAVVSLVDRHVLGYTLTRGQVLRVSAIEAARLFQAHVVRDATAADLAPPPPPVPPAPVRRRYRRRDLTPEP